MRYLGLTVENRTRAKLKTVLYFEGHPLHGAFKSTAHSVNANDASVLY